VVRHTLRASGSAQLAVVWLSDEVVEFLDAEVDAGLGRSRAELIARAFEREICRAKVAE
jgi:hypothetical protein